MTDLLDNMIKDIKKDTERTLQLLEKTNKKLQETQEKLKGEVEKG